MSVKRKVTVPEGRIEHFRHVRRTRPPARRPSDGAVTSAMPGPQRRVQPWSRRPVRHQSREERNRNERRPAGSPRPPHRHPRDRLDGRAGVPLLGHRPGKPGDRGYDDARRYGTASSIGIPGSHRGAAEACPMWSRRVTGSCGSTTMPLSIRGGGHQVAGCRRVADDGPGDRPVHDDRCPTSTPVARTDASRGRQRGGPHVDHATQLFGLATTGGEVSITGVAGLTLGGGLGLSRSAPLAWRATTCASSRSSPPTASCATAAPDEPRPTSSGRPRGGGQRPGRGHFVRV